VENIVKVTRRGQTTIPAKLRKKFGIKEGDQLCVKASGNEIIFKLIPKFEEMAGIDAGYATPEQINKMIDKLREEY
jgi:AbrB family looped-hinge helix DNA binding protein